MSTKASRELLNRLIGVNKRTGLGVSGKSSIPKAGLQFYADLWHPEQQGFLLSYDGNDYLSNATANFRSADSQGAIEVWFRSSSTASAQTLFASSDTGTTTSAITLFVVGTSGLISLKQQDNNDSTDRVNGATNVCDGKWHHILASSSGTAWSIFLDGVAENLSVIAGSNTGDWFADTTLRDNLTIGAQTTTSTVSFTTGEIGFTRIYSRPMLQPESQINYQRGRKAAASDTTGLVFNLPTTEGTGNPVDTVGSLTMTLTGATWVEGLMDRSTNAYPITLFGSPIQGSQGRTLALNKYGIVTGTAYNFTASDFSAWVWVKSTDLTAVNYLLSRGLASTDGWGFSITAAGAITFTTNQAAATQTSFSANAAVATGTWYMLGFSRAGAVGKVWKNVSGVMTNVTGTSGNHVNPLTSARTLKIGAYDDLSLALIGTIGEGDITSREFTLSEWNQIFNATRGKYGV